MLRLRVRLAALALALGLWGVVAGCGEPFDPASYIDSQRFLAVRAEPLEAGPGETIAFTALATNDDGTPYDGPIAWTILSGSGARLEGETPMDPALSQLTAGGEPFSWPVPARDALEATFGPMEKHGWLLTVVAAVPADGALAAPSRVALKLFVVSERAAAQRLGNPTIAAFEVKQSGEPVPADDAGEYLVARGKVALRSRVDAGQDGQVEFSWFARDRDFEPDHEGEQDIKIGERDLTVVYCVARQELFFEHDNGGHTRLTGLDWRLAPLRRQSD